MDTTQICSPQKNLKNLFRAWRPFEMALASVLEHLKEDQYLIISAKDAHRFVQFAGRGSAGLRAEAVSNHYLIDQEKLDRPQIRALKAMGWNAPKENNFLVDFESPVSYSDVAQLAVKTLTEVFGLPRPTALKYQAFNADGGAIELPSLGLQKEKPQTMEASSESCQSKMLTAMRKITGIPDLEVDEDGDVVVQYGDVNIIVSGVDDFSWFRIFSALLRDVEVTPALLSKLNALNDGVHRLRFFLHGNKVFVVTHVLADPFVAAHLAVSLKDFSETAESMAIRLQAEFSEGSVLEGDCGRVVLQ